MSTWGELGNWLSGKSLNDMLIKYLPDGTIVQVKAESVFQPFAEIGHQIKNATIQSNSPEERYNQYCNVLRSQEQFFDELDTMPDMDGHLRIFSDLINETQADLIIGTKGVICRVACVLLKKLGKKIPVINYVTNHAHFQFKLHHCEDVRMHFVRFPESRDYIIKITNFDPDKIITAGYLLNEIESDSITSPVQLSHSSRLSVIIMSNRGGAPYLKILERLLNRDNLDIVFLAINDAELCYKAQQLTLRFGKQEQVSVRAQLDQREFLLMLKRHKQNGPTLYISKASPNAVFEAVYLNLPVFLHRSGLPMEDWIAEKVAEIGIGTIDDSIENLIRKVEEHLDQPSMIDTILNKQLDFKSRYLDQRSTREKIIVAIKDIHADVANVLTS